MAADVFALVEKLVTQLEVLPELAESDREERRQRLVAEAWAWLAENRITVSKYGTKPCRFCDRPIIWASRPGDDRTPGIQLQSLPIDPEPVRPEELAAFRGQTIEDLAWIRWKIVCLDESDPRRPHAEAPEIGKTLWLRHVCPSEVRPAQPIARERWDAIKAEYDAQVEAKARIAEEEKRKRIEAATADLADFDLDA